MNIVQIGVQLALTALLVFAVVLIVHSLRARGKPWQKGIPGLGGAMYFLGFFWNLTFHNTDSVTWLALSTTRRYDSLLLLWGLTLMIAPYLLLMLREELNGFYPWRNKMTGKLKRNMGHAAVNVQAEKGR